MKYVKELLLKDGRKMLVLKEDEGISLELENTGTHEEESTEFLKTVIKPGMICYDIGANIGYYAFLELGLVGLDGFVYAFEPVPSSISCMKANIIMYNYTNIMPYEIALGFENKLVPMKLAKFSNSATMVDFSKASAWYNAWFIDWYTKDIIVEQWRLDDFRKLKNLPVPNLLRMDVEGYEVDVISGALLTLREMDIGSLLFIELHPPVFVNKEETVNDIVRCLERFGFTPIWADGQTNFNGDFVKWACEEERHCPHVFFIKE